MTVIPLDPSDPYRAVKVEVVDPCQNQLGQLATTEAAVYLRESSQNLYVAEVIRPHVVEYSPYRPNLNAPRIPLKWAATVIVRLRPEVVESRRGRLKGAKRDHLRTVPPPDEDDEPVS